MQRLTMTFNNRINCELWDGIDNFGYETTDLETFFFYNLETYIVSGQATLKSYLQRAMVIESCMFTEKSIFIYLII